MTTTTAAGYVYLVAQSPHGRTVLHKIGITRDPARRMRELGNPEVLAGKQVGTIVQARRLEGELHRRYERRRYPGSEYFHLAPDELEECRRLIAAAGVRQQAPPPPPPRRPAPPPPPRTPSSAPPGFDPLWPIGAQGVRDRWVAEQQRKKEEKEEAMREARRRETEQRREEAERRRQAAEVDAWQRRHAPLLCWLIEAVDGKHGRLQKAVATPLCLAAYIAFHPLMLLMASMFVVDHVDQKWLRPIPDGSHQHQIEAVREVTR